MGINLCDRKIYVGNYEIDCESFAAGVVVATGIGCIALGIKNIIQSCKLKRIENDYFDDSFDEEKEFEEYKFKREQKAKKRRKNKMKSGVAGVVFGTISATLGILYFTPCKKYLLDNSAITKIKDVDVPARIKAVTESDIIDRIKSSDLTDRIGSRIGTGIENGIKKVKSVDLSDKIGSGIENGIDKIKDIKKDDAIKVIVNIPKNVLDYIK